MAKPLGLIVYEGTSAIDGSPIAVIITGLKVKSTNAKTGGMVQSYIIRTDVAPTDAIRQGLDVAVCGSCPLRSVASGGSGACYVNVGHGPLAVFNAYKRGRYTRQPVAWAAFDIADTGRAFRIGTYGDPGAVPNAGAFWRDLTARLAPETGITGYTHRWRDTGAGLKGLCMASVDSPEEYAEAQARGWATFRVARKGDALRFKGEARCPASAEAGKRVTCETCPITCDGTLRPGNVGRVIQAHGATAKRVTG
jgi:hypothetical protein